MKETKSGKRVQCMKCGANRSCKGKPFTAKTLALHVSRAHDGRIKTRVNHRPLSERQQEVLDLVAAGYRDREIAQRLKLSRYTVAEHIRNCFKKLGVRTRAHALAKLMLDCQTSPTLMGPRPSKAAGPTRLVESDPDPIHPSCARRDDSQLFSLTAAQLAQAAAIKKRIECL